MAYRDLFFLYRNLSNCDAIKKLQTELKAISEVVASIPSLQATLASLKGEISGLQARPPCSVTDKPVSDALPVKSRNRGALK